MIWYFVCVHSAALCVLSITAMNHVLYYFSILYLLCCVDSKSSVFVYFIIFIIIITCNSLVIQTQDCQFLLFICYCL